MKTNLIKISVLTAVLVFVISGASWAEIRKNCQHEGSRTERIDHNSDRSANYHQSDRQYRHGNYHRRDYKRIHHRPAPKVRRHHYKHHRNYNRHHRYRHKMIRKHYRQYYRPYRESHSETAVESSNEFSIAATIFEPGFEISVGSKRTW